MLENLFSKLVEMSLIASCCIAGICIIRLFLKRTPKIYSYLLWSIVAVRLICPFGVESNISLFNLPHLQDMFSDEQNVADIPVFVPYTAISKNSDAEKFIPSEKDTPVQVAESYTNNNDSSEQYAENNYEPTEKNTSKGMNSLSANILHNIAIIPYLWIFGVLGLILYSIRQYKRLYHKINKNAIPGGSAYLGKKVIPVWECDSLSTPFIMGIWKAQIYLPKHLAEEDRAYVLAHESTHIRRKDYLIKQFAFLLTCIYWFNPVIWLAYFLMTKDMEMSCDETVLGKGELTVRKDYSNTLLSLSSEKYRLNGSPLAFGENNITSRIKNIMNYKKPAFWVSILCLIAFVILGAILTTNPKQTDIEADKLAKELRAYSDFLNLPEYNGFLLDSFEQPNEINWNAVFADGAGLYEKECSEEEMQGYFNVLGKDVNPEEFASVHHLEAEQINNFMLHKTGCTPRQMTHPLDWPYLSEYETYHIGLPDKTFYTEVECTAIKEDKYHKTVSLDYQNVDYGKPDCELAFKGTVTLRIDEDVSADSASMFQLVRNLIHENTAEHTYVRNEEYEGVIRSQYAATIVESYANKGVIYPPQQKECSKTLFGMTNTSSANLYHMPREDENVIDGALEQGTIVEIIAIGDNIYQDCIERGVMVTSKEECASFAKISYSDKEDVTKQAYVKATDLNLNIDLNTEDTFKYWIAKAWCEAFCMKDGDMLQAMLHDKTAFENLGWKNKKGTIQVLNLKDNAIGSGYDHSDAWPNRYFRLFMPSYEDTTANNNADISIYYYAETSEYNLPTVVVWRQELFLQKGQLENISRIEELFQNKVDATPLRAYDRINSMEDYLDACMTAYGSVYFNYKENDYLPSYSDDKIYEMSALNAAQRYLHLSPDYKMTETIDYLTNDKNEETDADNDDKRVILSYTFKGGQSVKDSTIRIPMYYDTELGIWCIDYKAM